MTIVDYLCAKDGQKVNDLYQTYVQVDRKATPCFPPNCIGFRYLDGDGIIKTFKVADANVVSDLAR